MENMITMAVRAGASIHDFEDKHDSAIIFTEKQLNDFIIIVINEYKLLEGA
jgi:hypothetical protein